MKNALFSFVNSKNIQLFSTFVSEKGKKDYEGQKKQYLPARK